MNLNLTGKTALICGSTQGIGWASAQVLADLGATCILFARNEEKLKANVEVLKNINEGKHGFITADFSQPENVRSVIEECTKNNQIDILVNNSGGPAAGNGPRDPFSWTDPR